MCWLCVSFSTFSDAIDDVYDGLWSLVDVYMLMVHIMPWAYIHIYIYIYKIGFIMNAITV